MKALIALSGGVDSACAAMIMKNEGYDCYGVTMRLHTPKNDSEGGCLTAQDIEDARGVCKNLDIPYEVVDFSSDFDKYVIENFISAYENGLTPNPCIECNFRLKFDKLYDYGKSLGCDYIVTGHYARIEYDEKYGRRVLKKGLDHKKDQSYVLWRLSKEKLDNTIFPLGNILSKDEARSLAHQAGLDVSQKKDSQDICFIPDGDYRSFLERYTGKAYPPGDYLDLGGKVVGKHSGAVGYTIGQRKGLGIALGEPVYVCSKDMDANTVTVGPDAALFSKELLATDWNWIAIESLTEPIRCKARVRYRHTEQPATVYPEENGIARVEFDEPQRAITPGQTVVLYDGDTVLGGGTIL